MAGDGRKFMARKSDSLSGDPGTDDSDGWLAGLVADEDGLDRHALWRLGLWGLAAVGALTLGILSSHLPVNGYRTQLAAKEQPGLAKEVEAAVQANKLEARRLAAAIDTLNSDRDRLFSRLSSIEQGLDVVTGSIKKAEEKPVTPWPDVSVAPIIESAPAVVASSPEATAKAPAGPAPSSATAPEPENPPVTVAARTDPPATEKPAPPPVIEAMPIPDPQPPRADASAAPNETSVATAHFGIDLGTANSINGLRALWRGLVKSHKPQLEALHPLIGVRERRNGLGLQLRLIAGPIKDAADVARICAVLVNADRDCKTTAFDGQRLSLTAEPEEKTPAARPKKQRQSKRAQPEPAPAKPAASSSSLATMLGMR